MHSKAASSPRWFARWRAAPRRPQDDPADVGTAFGLDLSLLPDPVDAPATRPPERRGGWAQRLTGRRRSL